MLRMQPHATVRRPAAKARDRVRAVNRVAVVEEDGVRRIVTKGALENVLAVCTAPPAGVGERFAEWSAKGIRVLGLATRVLAAGGKHFGGAHSHPSHE